MTLRNAANGIWGYFTGRRRPQTDARVTDVMTVPDAENPVQGFFRQMKEKGREAALPDTVIFDEARVKTLQDYSDAEARALRQSPFDPDLNEHDRLLQNRRQVLQSRLYEFLQEKDRCIALRRQLTLNMPGNVRKPKPSPFLVVTAIVVLGSALGVSLEPLFRGIEDSVQAWGAALVMGFGFATLAVWSLFHD